DFSDEVGDLLHLGVSADDKLVFGTGFQLLQRRAVLIFDGFGLLAGFDQVPDKSGGVAANEFGGAGLALIDITRHIGIAGHINDEVGGLRGKQLFIVGADAQAKLAG